MQRKKLFLPIGLLLLAAVALAGYNLGGIAGFLGLKPESNSNAGNPAIDPVPVKETATIRLYFAGEQAMGVIPEERTVETGGKPLPEVIVTELLRGPQVDPTLGITIPKEARLQGVELRDGIAYVNFSREVQSKHWGGSTGEMLTIQSVVKSLTDLEGIKGVQFLVEGQKLDSIWGHAETTGPFYRYIATENFYNGPERVRWLQEQVDQGHQPWRLSPLEVAVYEGGIAGFLSSDPMKLVVKKDKGEYSGTGEALVVAEHDGTNYDIELIQPEGAGTDKIWVINAVREKSSSTQDVDITMQDMDSSHWQIGDIQLKHDDGSTIYVVTMVNAEKNEIFKLGLDAVTGQIAREDERSSGRQLTEEEVRQREASIVSGLSIRSATIKQGDSTASVTLNFEGRIAARLRVDPATKKPLTGSSRVLETDDDEDEDEGSEDENDNNGTATLGRESENEEHEDRERGNRLISERMVEPLGWIATLLTIVVTLYYLWKRTIINFLKIAEEGKKQARAALKLSLNYHCYLSLLAFGIAVLHSWNRIGHIQWSTSWIALGMMAVVSISGFTGKYLFRRSATLRKNWRFFHVPFTVLFFGVLAVHIISKILGGDD